MAWASRSVGGCVVLARDKCRVAHSPSKDGEMPPCVAEQGYLNYTIVDCPSI